MRSVRLTKNNDGDIDTDSEEYELFKDRSFRIEGVADGLDRLHRGAVSGVVPDVFHEEALLAALVRPAIGTGLFADFVSP